MELHSLLEQLNSTIMAQQMVAQQFINGLQQLQLGGGVVPAAVPAPAAAPSDLLGSALGSASDSDSSSSSSSSKETVVVRSSSKKGALQRSTGSKQQGPSSSSGPVPSSSSLQRKEANAEFEAAIKGVREFSTTVAAGPWAEQMRATLVDVADCAALMRPARVLSVVKSRVAAKVQETFGEELRRAVDVEKFLSCLVAANPSNPTALQQKLAGLPAWNSSKEPAVQYLQKIVKLYGQFRVEVPHSVQEMSLLLSYWGADPEVMRLNDRLRMEAASVLQTGATAAVCFTMLHGLCNDFDAWRNLQQPPKPQPPRPQQQPQPPPPWAQPPPPAGYMGAAGGFPGRGQQQQGGRGRGQQQQQQGARGGAYDLDQRWWQQQQ
jgi:hypothetical protein